MLPTPTCPTGYSFCLSHGVFTSEPNFAFHHFLVSLLSLFVGIFVPILQAYLLYVVTRGTVWSATLYRARKRKCSVFYQGGDHPAKITSTASFNIVRGVLNASQYGCKVFH